MTKTVQGFRYPQITHDHAATTTTITTGIYLAPDAPAGSFTIERAIYIPSTSLAASDTDYVVITLIAGGNTMASWSTQTTGGNGAFTAGTPVKLSLSTTPANLWLAANAVLTLSVVCTGSPSVGAGSLRVEGRLQ